LVKNWGTFETWCNQLQLMALPATPESVEAFLVYLADDHPVYNRDGRESHRGLKPASVLQALWAVNQRHRLAGFPEPGQAALVRTAIAGIRRRKAHRPKQQAPLTIDDLAKLSFPKTLKGTRDKALLLIGFAGCFRRSEIVALRTENIESTRHGLRLYLPQSKTDALGKGAWVDIVRATRHVDTCPVRALQAWLDASNISSGPIFRSLTRSARTPNSKPLSAVAVDQLVKWAAVELGLDRTQYGGHSLRAGRATYLARLNKPPTLIAKHGRWQSLDMVLRYFRDETAEGLADAY
jgi:integrase